MIVQDRQSIFDIALINAGTAESAFEIAYANQITPSKNLVPGETIACNVVNNAPVVKYYSLRTLKPATKTPARKAIFDISFDNTFEIRPIIQLP